MNIFKKSIASIILLTISLNGFSSKIFNKDFLSNITEIYASEIERKMIADILKNDRKNFSLLDTGLISSAITNKQEISRLNQLFKQSVFPLISKLQLIPDNNNSQKDKARKILQLLHKTWLKKYSYHKTTLKDIFYKKNFNCVSSVFLFNSVASMLALKTRAVVIPGHLYAQIKIGNRWIDVETTNRRGFNPYRIKRATKRNSTRIFIANKSSLNKRIIISNLQLPALIYYNRGTLNFTKNNPEGSIRLFIKALKLFPYHFESSENLLTAYIQFINNKIDKKLFQKSLKILTEIKKVYGNTKTLKPIINKLYFEYAEFVALKNDFQQSIWIIQAMNNDYPTLKINGLMFIQSYYARWGQFLLDKKQYTKMFKVINDGVKMFGSKFLFSYRENLTFQASMKMFASNKFSTGFDFYSKHIRIQNESITGKKNRKYLLHNWAERKLKQENFESAYLVYNKALRLYPMSPAFKKNKQYTINKWVEKMTQQNDALIISKMIGLYKKYSEPEFIKALANKVAIKANNLQKQHQYKMAIEKLTGLYSIQSYLKNNIIKNLRKNIYLNWGVYVANNGNYDKAITIYKIAMGKYPKSNRLYKNLNSFYYNYSLKLINNKQFQKAKKVIRNGMQQFPNDKNLGKLKEYLAY